MKYKIAYIDENDGWINTFYQTFKKDFEVIKIKVDAESTVTSIVELLNLNDLDAVITDYLLEEEGDVSFNGNKIVDEIKKNRPHFPIIMLTSHEPQAISHMDDVHIIYGKSILDGESEEELEIFKSKIKSNIERYYSKIENTEKSIEELVKKKNEVGLEPNEEEVLTKLYILMDELDPEGKELPANLIQTGAITQLNDFVDQTRKILEELKKQIVKNE
jgi:DNA-binding NarL/FixJ family response regulator